MKYYIIAGEASGDLHGSNLIKEIIKKDPNAIVRCWGGDLMQQAGGNLVKHYKALAFMGFLQVLSNLRAISRNIAFCKKDIQEFHPDVIIFIDYSGFNLRIAKWAKAHQFKTNYYIAPQIWASREGRIKKIKRTIDKMYVILPFEKEFYEKKHHYSVDFVGHPLIDAINNRTIATADTFKKIHNLNTEQPIIALLPGSRKQEIQSMLSVMLSITDNFPDYQFVIAGAPSLEKDFYTPFITKHNMGFVANKTYDLLQIAHCALVTSGTATLETALFKVPQIVCYKTNWLTYQIAKRIINLEYISLVNLIMKKEVVKELIQNDLNTKKLIAELTKILKGEQRNLQLKNYTILEEKLGGKGASKKAASLIVENV